MRSHADAVSSLISWAKTLPQLGGRRMTGFAVRLVDHGAPSVPVSLLSSILFIGFCHGHFATVYVSH